MEPRPLFVLGKHRSGTTWLANQLCSHPDIAGVQHEEHYGIHESAYFERVRGRYGDLTVRANYVEFVRVLSASDYFRIAGADEAFLYSLWPASYEDVFRAVMTRFASRHGAAWWLEKSPGHTPLVRELHRAYADARFIGIIRDPVEVVSSVVARSVAVPGVRQDPLSRAKRIARVVVSWVHYNRAMTSFAADHPGSITITAYARLRVSNAEALSDLYRFLDLPQITPSTTSGFRRDTNIASERARREVLAPREARLVNHLVSVVELLPAAAFQVAEHTALRVLGRRELPTWFFRLLEEAPPETGAVPAVEVEDEVDPATVEHVTV